MNFKQHTPKNFNQRLGEPCFRMKFDPLVEISLIYMDWLIMDSSISHCGQNEIRKAIKL